MSGKTCIPPNSQVFHTRKVIPNRPGLSFIMWAKRRNDDPPSPPAANAIDGPMTTKRRATAPPSDDDVEVVESAPSSLGECAGGIIRGIAASMRGTAISSKSAIRAVGEARPLAFASEGAVAGDALLPRWAYRSLWGTSVLAICADVYVKCDDAPTSLRYNTALYWMAFHVPASLVVPAAIIHKVVHVTEDVVRDAHPATKNNDIGGYMLSKLSPRAKALLPVMAAMTSIIPVVPTVDHLAESIMEPTLGKYLGLEFRHHNDHGGHPPTPEDSSSPMEKEKAA